MNCWLCGAPLPETPYGKISFRATCEKCDAPLHCCKNCKNYAPGKPNDCLVPGTDYIADRSANNFCEDFSLLGKGPSAPDTGAKKRFDDLFR